jgi:RNA polymerase sigma factor (sigma-70 family)
MANRFSSSSSPTRTTSQSDLEELLALINKARGAFFVFALYNDATIREQVISELKQRVAPTSVFEWTYSPEAPYSFSYLDRLTEEQKRARAVVFFLDLELATDAEWKSLDYTREYLAEHPHGLIFWVTNEGRVDAARKASHFWAQRSAVYDFTIDDSEKQTAWPSQLEEPELPDEEYSSAQRQLELYQQLYDEYSSLPEQPTEALHDLSSKIAQMREHLDRLRKSEQFQKRLLISLDELDRELASRASSKAYREAASSREITSAIRNALNALTDRDREIIELRHFHDLSFNEIAKVLGISEGAAKIRNNRALAKLRDILEPKLRSRGSLTKQ